jgi:glucosylceramidase
VLQAALAANPQIKVQALPWSPPGWMKTSGVTGGGSLNTADFDALAKYFVKFVQAYGVPWHPYQLSVGAERAAL